MHFDKTPLNLIVNMYCKYKIVTTGEYSVRSLSTVRNYRLWGLWLLFIL